LRPVSLPGMTAPSQLSLPGMTAPSQLSMPGVTAPPQPVASEVHREPS